MMESTFIPLPPTELRHFDDMLPEGNEAWDETITIIGAHCGWELVTKWLNQSPIFPITVADFNQAVDFLVQKFPDKYCLVGEDQREATDENL